MPDGADWDAICIGSGLGALAAAARLAQAGRRVLVLERRGNFGGAATLYRRPGLTVEASLHEIDGASLAAPGGIVDRLGLRDALEGVRIDDFYQIRGGPLSRPVTIHSDLAATARSLTEAFPEAAAGLRRYLRRLDRIGRALGRLEARPGLASALAGLADGSLFSLLGALRLTLQQALDADLGGHEAAKLALAGPIGYFDDDPARLSFLFYGAIWVRYVTAGSWYIRGGSAALTRALLGSIGAAGGRALRRAEVVAIGLDRAGRAAEVVWQAPDGTRSQARAPVILGGAAPRDLAAMLPAQAGAAFAARYAGLEPSVSLFSLALGLDRPAAAFGVGSYATFVLPPGLTRLADYPPACAALSGPPGARLPPYVIADYGRLPTGLRQPGDRHLVTLTGIDRLAWWPDPDAAAEHARRAAWIEAFVADLDRHFPGIGASVTTAELANARTMRSRLGTPDGSVYGFRPTPVRLFGTRPMARTAVPGLYLASAYTVSGGYAGALHGGLMAAEAALADRPA